MSRPTSKTRWVTSPSLPRLPCTSPTTWPTCWSCCWTPLPTCPICAVIWLENWCSSSFTVASVSVRAWWASVRAVWMSRWRSSRAWSGCWRAASSAPSRATARHRASAVSPTRTARATTTTHGQRRHARAPRRPRQWRHTGRSPHGAQTASTRRSRHWPDIRVWQSEKSYFTGSAGSRRRRPAVISSAIFQFRLRRRVSPSERAMFSICVSTGIRSAAGGNVGPEPEVGRLAPHHPAQEEMQALARPAGGRPREPVPEAVGEPVAREDRREILGEERVDEALEGGAHMRVLGGEAGAEAGAERAVADQDALGGQAEGGEIARAIEAVAEALEARGVLRRIEAQDEAGGRLPHAGEGPVDPRAEEIHPAVGHARWTAARPPRGRRGSG